MSEEEEHLQLVRGELDPMVLVVGGSRDGISEAFVWKALDKFVERVGRPNLLVHGACRGVDSFADSWAKSRGVPVDPHPAEWVDARGRVDRRQGPIRNAKMVKLATHCLVIRRKISSGSEDLEKQAKRAGVKTYVWVV